MKLINERDWIQIAAILEAAGKNGFVEANKHSVLLSTVFSKQDSFLGDNMTTEEWNLFVEEYEDTYYEAYYNSHSPTFDDFMDSVKEEYFLDKNMNDRFLEIVIKTRKDMKEANV